MFYLFHGDDEHSQRETMTDLVAKLGDPGMIDLNTSRFEGNVTVKELRNACDAIPFLAPARLVIVRDLFSKKQPKSFLDELLAYLPNLPEKTRLIFLESTELSHTHALVKLAESHEKGYVKKFTRPQGSDLEKWIQNRVRQQNGRINGYAAQLLAANVGNDLRALSHEIDKLVIYKGDEGAIDEKDVALLCPYAAEANIFDLVDAVGNRNAAAAASLLQQKLNDGTDPFYLFTMFVRQFRLLIQVKELSNQGFRAPEIAKELKMHSFVAGKLYQQASGFTMQLLERVYSHLLDIDLGVKTGKADMTIALQLLVVNLAAA
jgi:DNA polymerase-3 subunit delta